MNIYIYRKITLRFPRYYFTFYSDHSNKIERSDSLSVFKTRALYLKSLLLYGRITRSQQRQGHKDNHQVIKFLNSSLHFPPKIKRKMRMRERVKITSSPHFPATYVSSSYSPLSYQNWEFFTFPLLILSPQLCSKSAVRQFHCSVSINTVSPRSENRPTSVQQYPPVRIPINRSLIQNSRAKCLGSPDLELNVSMKKSLISMKTGFIMICSRQTTFSAGHYRVHTHLEYQENAQ